MTDERSADQILAEAIAELRNKASWALPGPWYSDGDAGVYAWTDKDEPFPDVIKGGGISHGDSQWIGMMGPQLAEPLAVYLEHAIPYARLARWRDYPVATQAVAVAQVILGEYS